VARRKKDEKFDAEAYEAVHGAGARPMTEDPAPQPELGHGARRMIDAPKKKER
jgi:hypothetical protein